MATYNKYITRGVHLWWRDGKSTVWIELGKNKAKLFCDNNKWGKRYLLLIPPPWGQMAWLLANEYLKESESKRNKRWGLWTRWGVQGYIRSKERTSSNKRKAPRPW